MQADLLLPMIICLDVRTHKDIVSRLSVGLNHVLLHSIILKQAAYAEKRDFQENKTDSRWQTANSPLVQVLLQYIGYMVGALLGPY